MFFKTEELIRPYNTHDEEEKNKDISKSKIKILNLKGSIKVISA